MFIVCSLVSLIFITEFSTAKLSSVVIIGHRGASGYLPEHTLPTKALAVGQDVVLSKDNIPIVLHDIYLDELSNVANTCFHAIDFTVAEIKTLRASERFDYRTGKPIFPNRFSLNQSRF